VNVIAAGTKKSVDDMSGNPTPLHPAWLAFIRYCAELKHGEIDQAPDPGRHTRPGGNDEEKSEIHVVK
jgi:hypothetical protein